MSIFSRLFGSKQTKAERLRKAEEFMEERFKSDKEAEVARLKSEEEWATKAQVWLTERLSGQDQLEKVEFLQKELQVQIRNAIEAGHLKVAVKTNVQIPHSPVYLLPLRPARINFPIFLCASCGTSGLFPLEEQKWASIPVKGVTHLNSMSLPRCPTCNSLKVGKPTGDGDFEVYKNLHSLYVGAILSANPNIKFRLVLKLNSSYRSRIKLNNRLDAVCPQCMKVTEHEIMEYPYNDRAIRCFICNFLIDLVWVNDKGQRID